MNKITLILSGLLLANFCYAETTVVKQEQTFNDGTSEVTEKIVETDHDALGTVITETTYSKTHGLAGTTISKSTEKFRVTGLTPTVVNLKPGRYTESAILQGDNLDKIEKVYLIKNGEIVEEVTIDLDQVINNTRQVNLRFNENYVQDSDLQFVVVSGNEVIAVPGTVTYTK